MSACSFRTLIPFLGALAIWLSAPAFAQGSRTIMRGNADGTHEVLMLTAPSYFALRTPDFTASDLPVIQKALVLSDEQTGVVRQHIERYIVAFRELTKSFAAETSPEGEYVPDSEKKAEVAETNPDDGTDVKLDDLNLPGDVNISIGMSTSRSRSDDPEAPAPPPVVKVSVTLDSPEGDAIPQETIDTIRHRANVVAANIVARMMAEEAARAAGEPEPPKPVFEAEDNFETIKARHDALLEKVERFIKAKAKLREQFVTDAQTILSDEQISRWPALERALYRQRNLPKAQLPGESVDVIGLIESLKLSEDALHAIAGDLEAFEIALDAALRQRDALLSTATQKIDEAIANKKPDLALSLNDRVTSARIAVRNINLNQGRVFVDLLGTEQGGAFWKSLQKAAYSRVFSQTRGEKMFDSIYEMENIDDEALDAVTRLHDGYAQELAEINEQLRAAVDRESATASRRGIEHLKDSMEGKPSKEMDREDPVRALFIKRAELDDRYIKLAAEVLGPERAAGLPKVRKNREAIRIDSDSSS